MRHGPCGGARPDGHCEVPGVRCPFLERSEFVATDLHVAGRELGDASPRVVVDFRPDPTLERELQEAAEELREAGAWVLIGEHVDDPTPHRPAVIAEAVASTGLSVIATLTCRDRSAARACDELDELLEVGVAAVHCVTGDHPAARLGLDTAPSFPIDGLELTAIAARQGAVVSVAESPAAAPAAWRPRRLLDKQRSGASLAVLNHGGDVAAMVDFARRCRDLGVTIPLVAPVPVITDRRSADALDRFPGLVLPPRLRDLVLGASQPEAAGIAAATEIAEQLLESGWFVGVNLSGPAGAGGIVGRARIMAGIARRVGT